MTKKMNPIKDISLKSKNVDALVKEFYLAGGFTAKKFAQGVDILEEMMKDKEECLKFLSFPACICATGTRGVLKELIKKNFFDIVITTCGTLDHDLARIWKNYYHGSFFVDDKKLHSQGINRLGNIFIPNESYGIILEKKLQKIFDKIFEDKDKEEISGYELIWEVAKNLKKEKRKEESITYWCWKNKIPVIIPGFFDGAFGSQLWMFWQRNRKKIKINLFEDEQKISDLIFQRKKTGALVIGGGISKHHLLWWNQFKSGLDYAVYITTAQEFDGSLSGARVREAISWGKVKERGGKFVTIDGDATLLLPIMVASLFERLKI